MEAVKEPSSGDSILDELKAYTEIKLRLLKYQSIDKGSTVIADIIYDMVLGVCLLFILVFSTVALAYYLAWQLSSEWAGFGCVAVLYILLTLLLAFFKKSIEKLIVNLIIRKNA
jgi:positive regulator of sigma E activity